MVVVFCNCENLSDLHLIVDGERGPDRERVLSMDEDHPLKAGSICGRICFFLFLAGAVLLIILLSITTRHYFLPGPTPQNPKFFH